jgi:hypothetical protein
MFSNDLPPFFALKLSQERWPRALPAAKHQKTTGNSLKSEADCLPVVKL